MTQLTTSLLLKPFFGMWDTIRSWFYVCLSGLSILSLLCWILLPLSQTSNTHVLHGFSPFMFFLVISPLTLVSCLLNISSWRSDGHLKFNMLPSLSGHTAIQFLRSEVWELALVHLSCGSLQPSVLW